MKQKGQMTVIGVVMIAVTLIVMGAITPIMTETIAIIKANPNVSSAATTVLDFSITMLYIGLIIGIVVFATGGQSEPRRY